MIQPSASLKKGVNTKLEDLKLNFLLKISHFKELCEIVPKLDFKLKN
jgi:hypothetical protein